MFIAITVILCCVLVSIALGSLRSVQCHAKEKLRPLGTDEVRKVVNAQEAFWFPLLTNGAVWGIFLERKRPDAKAPPVPSTWKKRFIFNPMRFIAETTGALNGVYSVNHALLVVSEKLPTYFSDPSFHIKLSSGSGKSDTSRGTLVDKKFKISTVACLIISIVFGVTYFNFKRSVLLSNILIVVVTISAIEVCHLNQLTVGLRLLGSSLLKDYLAFFGLDLMGWSGLRLHFPPLFLEPRFDTYLGLPDLVAPGIFMALLLRFDNSHGSSGSSYFKVTLMGYITSLIAWYFVASMVKPMPAATFLIPTCVIIPLVLALKQNQFRDLLDYRDYLTLEGPKKESIEPTVDTDSEESSGGAGSETDDESPSEDGSGNEQKVKKQ